MDKFSPARTVSVRGGTYNSRYSPSKYSMTFRGGPNAGGLDSRDLIINQLKRDIVDMKSSERNMSDVNAQLITLEHKYRILQDEKNVTDRDARTRTEKNIRNIATLKSKADTSKRQLEHLNKNYDNLLADLGELEALGERKKDELDNVTASEKEARELRIRIEEEIAALRRKISKERDNRSSLQDDIDVANRKLDSLVEQDKEYDRKFAVIEEDLRQKAKTLESQSALIAEKEREIAIRQEIILERSNEIDEANRELSELQLEKDAKRRELDRGANQLATLKVAVKKCEAENSDIEQQIHDLSVDIRQNNTIINSKNNELTNYTKQNEDIQRENEQLEKEIVDLKNSIQEIINLNKEIIGTVGQVQVNDERVAAQLGLVSFTGDIGAMSMRSGSMR